MNSHFFQSFQGNEAFVEDMYQQYLQNPDSVAVEWRRYFEQASPQQPTGICSRDPSSSPGEGTAAGYDAPFEQKVFKLIQKYKAFGHLKANINPLYSPENVPSLELSTFDLGQSDLNKQSSVAALEIASTPLTLHEILETLESQYCGTVGIEIEHISSAEEKSFLSSRLKNLYQKAQPETQLKMYEELARADALEQTLNTKYIGQKRFSIEGADAQLCALESFMDACARTGTKEFSLAMAHRGRLNVLVHTTRKPVKELFALFSGRYSEEFLGDGDVKYHFGYMTERETRSGLPIRVSLSNNPSHLEFVDSVVLGEARAQQDLYHDGDRRAVCPVVLHGDAAISGQGSVYESLAGMNIGGFDVGGALHIVANNQVGYTTNPYDSRSTPYCTDIAKYIECPVFHVNAEDIDALHSVMEIAAEYRQTFGKDVFVDLICYRKHGHNEGDDPTFTQPVLYKKIKAKKAPYKEYATTTLKDSFSQEELEAKYKDIRAEYRKAYEEGNEEEYEATFPPKPRGFDNFQKAGEKDILKACDTSIGVDTLKKLAHTLLDMPEGFTPHKKINKNIIGDRNKMANLEKNVDWGFGELLAYASLLSEDTNVRVVGQDASRGTFSHRQATLVDEQSGQRVTTLNNVNPENAQVEIIDSYLSESGVLGFEYGYAAVHPKCLNIWEAQFGDFSNGAQVIIDQFLVSGEAKWGQSQALTLLLPHGYEGEGPEHSSARLERFLQLAAEGNMQVCYFTNVKQLFHAFRRQVRRNFRKPMVIMSPKSFLRSPLAGCSLEELAQWEYQEILNDTFIQNPNSVEKIVICSGKLAIDVEQKRKKEPDDAHKKVAVLRLEQLYPFHMDKVSQLLATFKKVKSVFWAQEEPRNMGAWSFISEPLSDAVQSVFKGKLQLKYIGRPRKAAPSTGFKKVHEKEQAAIVSSILSLP